MNRADPGTPTDMAVWRRRGGVRTEQAELPTLEEMARLSAWSVFGDATRDAHAATGTDRLRRYADACQRAADAYHDVRRFGGGDP